MIKMPDVEALFEFNNLRKNPAVDGYRPAHLVLDNYLTTGIHHYYGVDSVLPGETARGTISFITPEAYPHCLWIGKKINIQEGDRIVGYATVTDIYNPVLENTNINLFIKLLIATLNCAEKEISSILDGKISSWNLTQIQSVISEINEILSYAKKGEFYSSNNENKRILRLDFFDCEPFKTLYFTELGERILNLQKFYNTHI